MDRLQRDLYVRTIIGEAGNQPVEGQAGVAHVIRNRLNSGRWGDTLDGVILAPKQFSLWNPGDPAGLMAKRVTEDSPQYQRIGKLVDGVMAGEMADPTGGALNYYNPAAASPAWGPGMANKIQIGAHLFGTAGGSGDTSPPAPPLVAATSATPPAPVDTVSKDAAVAQAGNESDNAIGKAIAAMASGFGQPQRQAPAPQSAQLPPSLFTIRPNGPSYQSSFVPPSMRGRVA